MSVDLKKIFDNRIKIDSKVRSIMGVFFNIDSHEYTDYKPSYQRNYVWDDEKASYFIESIFLGTEIPPLVYFKTVTEEAIKNEIIDGRQRYQSILRFINGELRLKKSGLQRLGDDEELVGKNFDELSNHYKSLFQDTKIRIIEFRFLTDHTAEEEERLKKEIFQRYNSGITPLHNLDLNKAQYYYNELNSFLKHELKDDTKFNMLLSRVLRLEKSKLEQKVMKIREMLVLTKIPIKYFAIQKQKVIRKYFELLSDQITEDEIKDVFDNYKRRLYLLAFFEQGFSELDVPYNRLIGDCLYWAISIVETEKKTIIAPDLEIRDALVHYFKENIDKYTTVRSSFANILFERFNCTAAFFSRQYSCDFRLYLYNNEQFKKDNKHSTKNQDQPLSFDELRINKPEPTSVEVSELLLNINSNRFLIRPPYQRNEVGNKKKSSSIIESLLLGIMLPPIFVYKRDDGVSEVIDGQQRLLSILGYIGKPYRDENFNEQYSQLNEFALDLKDSGILKGLHNYRFCDLKIGDRNKIMSSDLWVIDIKESQNKNFDPVDLFVRLNNKPYPIAKDSFEMWNSFASRKLIDTIKVAVRHNDKWFYLRKNNARMDNESLFTTLAYFQYAYQRKGNVLGDIVPERTIELYKIENRINCRFRMRSDITKIMEQEDNVDFVTAINKLEFGFVKNIKTILSNDNQIGNTSILSKKFDLLMNFESSKRTQMMFYVLWILVHDLSSTKIAQNIDIVFYQVKHIVSLFSNGSDIESFKESVSVFRKQYITEEQEVDCRLSDVSEIYEYQEYGGKSTFDMCVDLQINPQRRFNVFHISEPCLLQKHQIGLKINREGINSKYVECILKSRWFYFYSVSNTVPQIKKNVVYNLGFPLASIFEQTQMAKILDYTIYANGLEREYFERILDCMVYELTSHEEFNQANISFFEIVKDLLVLSSASWNDEQRRVYLKEVYTTLNHPNSKMSLYLLKSIDLSIARMIENEYVL